LPHRRRPGPLARGAAQLPTITAHTDRAARGAC